MVTDFLVGFVSTLAVLKIVITVLLPYKTV